MLLGKILKALRALGCSDEVCEANTILTGNIEYIIMLGEPACGVTWDGSLSYLWITSFLIGR